MNVLSSASALNTGSDLWIIPDAGHCHWTSKLDWYLNFQIIKNQRHLSPQVPAETKSLQEQTGLEVFEKPLTGLAPLMIDSHAFFPNKWVVIVPMSNHFEAWVVRASAVWENLRNPSLRVFLPTGQNAGSFYKEWQKHHSFEDFTLVLD